MRKLIFFLAIILLAACTSKTILKKPKNLIPKDTMVLLLTDLYIAKSASPEKNINNERKINYVSLVYNKYLIDSTRFMNSNYYYTSKLEEYDLIFKEVKENLALKREKIEEKVRSVLLNLQKKDD
jgi:hypothetical protein